MDGRSSSTGCFLVISELACSSLAHACGLSEQSSSPYGSLGAISQTEGEEDSGMKKRYCL